MSRIAVVESIRVVGCGVRGHFRSLSKFTGNMRRLGTEPPDHFQRDAFDIIAIIHSCSGAQ